MERKRGVKGILFVVVFEIVPPSKSDFWYRNTVSIHALFIPILNVRCPCCWNPKSIFLAQGIFFSRLVYLVVVIRLLGGGGKLALIDLSSEPVTRWVLLKWRQRAEAVWPYKVTQQWPVRQSQIWDVWGLDRRILAEIEGGGLPLRNDHNCHCRVSYYRIGRIALVSDDQPRCSTGRKKSKSVNYYLSWFHIDREKGERSTHHARPGTEVPYLDGVVHRSRNNFSVVEL